MANKSPFEKAHYGKILLNKKTEKKIKRAYSTTAKEMKAKLAILKSQVGGTTSDALKQLYLKDLLNDLNQSISSLEKQVQMDILRATEASGNLAIRASNEVMENFGLGGINKAFAYVPRQEMANILSGKLYGSNWSFSKAIWGAEKKTKEDLEKIVARGLAGNKPIYDIAKDLEKYVNPSARKPWDWSKVYPGTSKTVDYNAQRLARTMIQHSFQTSMVQAQRYNPFCKGIIWYSVGIHGRTCATCLDRDGQVFPVKDLPLDHPNGLCYFEPSLDSMNNVADRLGDWVNGKSDPGLDNYVAKAFNIDPKSLTGKKAISAVKEKTREKTVKKASTQKKATSKKPSGPMDKGKFIDAKFRNLKKQVIQGMDNIGEDGEMVWNALRKRMLELEEDHLRYMSLYQNKLRKLTYLEEEAYFNPNDGLININLIADMQNLHGKGAFTTFFHEYGHLIDDFARLDKAKVFTGNAQFRKSLYKLMKEEYNDLYTKVNRNQVLLDLMDHNTSSGVQDIISGLSMNKDRIVWGHDTEYWRLKGQEKGVVLEAMAHFNAAWANPEVRVYWKRYFPKSYQYIKDRAITLVERKAK